MFNIEVWFYLLWLNGFNLRKISKAYYEFRVLYVVPVPSAGHGPISSGRDKVSIRAMVSLLILELSFCVFLHYCGIRLSNVSFVIIAFSILRCVCFVVVFDFVCLVFLDWEGEHEMLMLLKQLKMLSSPFWMKLLLLNIQKEVAVVDEYCLRL